MLCGPRTLPSQSRSPFYSQVACVILFCIFLAKQKLLKNQKKINYSTLFVLLRAWLSGAIFTAIHNKMYCAV